MGSHSVTCHLTQVNAPRLNPGQKAGTGTQFTYPGGIEGWVDLVAGYISDRVPAHLNINWAWLDNRNKGLAGKIHVVTLLGMFLLRLVKFSFLFFFYHFMVNKSCLKSLLQLFSRVHWYRPYLTWVNSCKIGPATVQYKSYSYWRPELLKLRIKCHRCRRF